MTAILFLLALICEVIAALLGFGIFSGPHVLGWISLGLAFAFGALLLGTGIVGTIRRE